MPPSQLTADGWKFLYACVSSDKKSSSKASHKETVESRLAAATAARLAHLEDSDADMAAAGALDTAALSADDFVEIAEANGKPGAPFVCCYAK